MHLQERVEQLTRKLRGNGEKLSVYECRMTGASGAVPVAEQLEDLPREQQLEQEAELRLVLKNCLWCRVEQIQVDIRSTLKVAQVDLAAARSHMQQF